VFPTSDFAPVEPPPGGIPRQNTPGYDPNGIWFQSGCGYKKAPSPILRNCTEPLSVGVPDLRGTWKGPGREEGTMHVERIEQCGDRVIVTSDCVIHDFLHANGKVEDGVHDVTATALPACVPIKVSGYFEGLCLRMKLLGILEATSRCLNPDDTLQFEWGGSLNTTMARVDGSELKDCD